MAVELRTSSALEMWVKTRLAGTVATIDAREPFVATAFVSDGGTLPDDDTTEFARAGVQVVAEPIRRLESTDGRLLAVELVTGERIERDAGFISDEYSEPANTFAEQLGVTSSMNDWGQTGLEATEAGGTNIPGLHVIGDARTGFSGLIAAAAEGAACAETIVHEIATERWTNR